MDTRDYGLRDPDFLDHISNMIPSVVSARRLGYDSQFRSAMHQLMQSIWEALRSDLRKGENPALTEWRLDSFYEWFEGELKARAAYSLAGHLRKVSFSDAYSLFSPSESIE
jgi:hypothetical protein